MKIKMLKPSKDGHYVSDSQYCRFEFSELCESCPFAVWFIDNDMECKFPFDGAEKGVLFVGAKDWRNLNE